MSNIKNHYFEDLALMMQMQEQEVKFKNREKTYMSLVSELRAWIAHEVEVNDKLTDSRREIMQVILDKIDLLKEDYGL